MEDNEKENLKEKLNEVYEKLIEKGIEKIDGPVKITKGMFSDRDLIPVVYDNETGEVKGSFQIDKESMIEFMEKIMPEIEKIEFKNDYNYMSKLFDLLENEIQEYYGKSEGPITKEEENEREVFYTVESRLKSGQKGVITMKNMKDKRLGMCVEKSSLANNALKMLHEMDAFDYDIEYLNSMCELEGEKPGDHAFLKFDRISNKGERINIIYDISNKIKIEYNDQEIKDRGIYLLKDDEYEEFINGGSFDNSKYILSDTYKVLEKREYSAYNMEKEQTKEDLDKNIEEDKEELQDIENKEKDEKTYDKENIKEKMEDVILEKEDREDELKDEKDNDEIELDR